MPHHLGPGRTASHWTSDVKRVRTHRWTLLSLLGVVPLGLYSKFYVGPAALWVHNALVGVWDAIFWCLLIFVCHKTPKPWVMALWVCSVTCRLEVLQLWHPPVLVSLRGFFLGRLVLGTTFAWSDFPHYMLGCALAWLWMRWLHRSHGREA